MTDQDVPTGPCILLNIALGVVHVNRAAQQLLDSHPARLAVHQQRLHAAEDPLTLARCLTQAQRGLRVAMSLPRPGRLPLTLRAEPLRTLNGDLLRVTLRDPELEAPDPALLQGLFGLTPTEALVAANLAQGMNSADMARAMGVQPNTVLSHIKRVLTKSGARRQAQFVSLVLRSVAMPSPAAYPAAPSALAPGLAQMGNATAPLVEPIDRRSRPAPCECC